jgi:uncharacterized protein YlbG (UPF0298 family)
MIPQTAPALLSLNKNLFCRKDQLKKMVEMMMESRFLKMFQLFFFPSIKLIFAKKKNLSSSKMVEMES